MYGEFRPVFLKTKANEDVFCYFRILDGKKFYIECNLTEKTVRRPAPLAGNLVLRAANYRTEDAQLRPYEANVYEVM